VSGYSLVGATGFGHEVAIDETVRAAQRGDDTAFAALYDAHAPRVYGLCLRLSGDPVHARDLVQDVFVRVWERLGSYRGESAFTTWLHRVAVNTALQAGRSRRRRSLRVTIDADLHGLSSSGATRTIDAPAKTPDPGAALDMEQCIAALPPGARAVFVLHDVEGFSHAEVGAHLGIAEGTSKAHLFRARRLLREALER
jgi:RNA polymerase sigma-70 factor (ECF subfamily)